jgi:sporulation protein YlmC with PRC-barrel domain
MTMPTTTRRNGALALAGLLSSVLAVSASAQTPPPSTDGTPPAVRIDPMPLPPANTLPRDPGASRSDTQKSDALKPDMAKPAMPESADAAIGMSVFTSDGRKIGEVKDVKPAPDGKTSIIHIKTGGFLGFGGKIVEIPPGKFAKSGRNVQLGLTYEEVNRLPVIDGRPS